VSFFFFTELKRRCNKLRVGTARKPGATAIPQTKGLGALAHDPGLM